MSEIEEIFASLNREVWIITAGSRESGGGLVATWVSPFSLPGQPPTLLIALAPHHHTAQLIDRHGSFGAHLIRPDQLDVVWNFGLSSGRDGSKLAALEWTVSTATGSPILNDCVSWLDCRVFHRLTVGDRTLYWSDVVDSGRRSESPVLREQALFASADAARRSQLRANLNADVRHLEPLRQAWRGGL